MTEHDPFAAGLNNHMHGRPAEAHAAAQLMALPVRNR